MNSKLRYIFTFIKFFIIIFIIIQPYNLFCNISLKCSPFYLSSLIPKKEGKEPIDVKFEVKNLVDDLYVAAEQDIITTYTNRRNVVEYVVKNESDHLIRFRPVFYAAPEESEQYINRYECSCSKEYKLKSGEEVKLKIDFALKEGIIKDPEGDFIKIGFRIKLF